MFYTQWRIYLFARWGSHSSLQGFGSFESPFIIAIKEDIYNQFKNILRSLRRFWSPTFWKLLFEIHSIILKIKGSSCVADISPSPTPYICVNPPVVKTHAIICYVQNMNCIVKKYVSKQSMNTHKHLNLNPETDLRQTKYERNLFWYMNICIFVLVLVRSEYTS